MKITDKQRLDFMLALPCFRRVAYSSRRSIDVAIRAEKKIKT